jgi:hypothetical protein
VSKRKLLIVLALPLFLGGCVWPWQTQYMSNSTFVQSKPAVQAAKESSDYYATHEKDFTPEQRAEFAKNNAAAWTQMGELFRINDK